MSVTTVKKITGEPEATGSGSMFDGDATGATDVGALINAAALANDGIVELPEGIFLVETPIDPSVDGKNLFLKGQGVGRTIIKYPFDVKDDAGNVCGAISYNGKAGSLDYDGISARIGDSQTAVVVNSKTITGISSSATTPTVTTSANHGLASGVPVYISGVVSTSAATTITAATSGSGGITLTATAHGLRQGQVVSPQSFSGGTWNNLSGNLYKVYQVTANTFKLSTLDGAPITTSFGTFTSGTTQLGIGGMYLAVLISGTTTATTFRLHDINGDLVDTSGITYSSGGTMDNYFNRYNALTINGANGDYVWYCDVADASGYSAGDYIHMHSQDDYLSALNENRWTGENNTILFADHNADRLYFTRPVAFRHIYHTSPIITRYKATQRVMIEGISFTNDSVSGDPLDYPFSVDPGSNVSSAIDIFGVVRPVIKDCEFSRCWGTAVRYLGCPEMMHLQNDTDRLLNADVYNNVTEKDITGITAANPPVVTMASTSGITDGNPVVIRNVVGTTQANNGLYQARNVTGTTLELYDMNNNPVNGSAWSAYVSGGKISEGNVRRLGYGVSAYGPTSGIVDGGIYKNGRHPFTTDGRSGTYSTLNRWYLWGQPTNCVIKNITSYDAYGPGLDTHEEGRFIEFTDCEIMYPTRSPDATDTYSTGLNAQVRCLDVTFRNCRFEGGRQQVRLANTDHTIIPKTDFINCVFRNSTPVVETNSGNKEGGIIVDSSESTNNKFWPRVNAHNCLFENVGAAVYMTAVSGVNVSSQAKFYDCKVLRCTTAADIGPGARFEMHGGVIDYSGIDKLAMRRRATAYCTKLRDDATAAVGATSILNGVTIIRGETTSLPSSIFERNTNAGITKNFWGRNVTVMNPSNLSSSLPVLSAKNNMVELTNIRDAADLLTASNTAVGNVGTGEDNLISYTLPSNTLYAAGRGVEIVAWGTGANNANAKTVKLYFGSQVIATLALTISQANTWRAEGTVIATGDDTQDYEGAIYQSGTVNNFVLSNGAATQDDGANLVIKCTGEATSNNDIVQEGMTVKLI